MPPIRVRAIGSQRTCEESRRWTSVCGRVSRIGNGTRTYDDIGPIELGVPGAPTIDVISWGDTYVDVTWDARGDEYDLGTAYTWEVYVNNVLKTSGSPGAPGTPQSSSPGDLSACTNYDGKV